MQAVSTFYMKLHLLHETPVLLASALVNEGHLNRTCFMCPESFWSSDLYIIEAEGRL